MKDSPIFYFFRQQRQAVVLLLVMTGGVLAFRYWRQQPDPEPDPNVPYEQFRSEIEAFEAQLEEKAPVTKPRKAPGPRPAKRSKSRPEVQPKVQSMQAIQETAEEEVSMPVGESRRIVPMEEE